MEKKLRKVFALARVTGIPADVLKHILGIPGKIVSSAHTFNQALAFFRQSKVNSERIFAHLDAMIEHTETFEQAMEVLEETDYNSPEAEKALNKVLSFARVEHIEEIRTHLGKATFFSWGEHQKWLDKWNELSLEQVGQAKTEDEFLRAYLQAPIFSSARIAALKGFCTIADEGDTVDLLRKIDSETGSTPAELLVLIEHYLAL